MRGTAGVSRESGSAAMELGIMLPALLLFIASLAPVFRFGFDYMAVSRAVAHGVRYASRVNPEAEYAPDLVTLTRRPTVGQVKEFVRLSSGSVDLSNATISVTPDPWAALSGDTITVEVTHAVALGILDDIVNTAANLVGGDDYMADSMVMKVSAQAREE